PVVISENELVMLVRKERAWPGDIETIEDLVKPGVRVGLADPEKSALGVVTREFLERHRLYEALEASGNCKLWSPTGEYLVAQIRAGAIDAVIVYRSNALANPKTLDEVGLSDLKDKKARATQPFAIARF